MITLHGTCLDIAGLGVLLRGRSGAGKSDLALRLLEDNASYPARLVADDRVVLARKQGRLVASAPSVLRGQLEVRGIGVVQIPVCDSITLGLVVDLAAGGDIERAPEFPQNRIMVRDVELPHLRLNPFEASAVAKIRMAVSILRQPGHDG